MCLRGAHFSWRFESFNVLPAQHANQLSWCGDGFLPDSGIRKWRMHPNNLVALTSGHGMTAIAWMRAPLGSD